MVKRRKRNTIPLPFSRMKKKKLGTNPSFFGLPYEEVSFLSRQCSNVVLLKGWYIPLVGSKRCIIMIHGLNTNRAHSEVKLLEIAKAFYNQGYNILTFDLRAHGESEGDHLWLGYYEAYDVLGAFDFLVGKKKISPRHIGMMGFSYGAMAAILAAKKEKIAALVVDSCPGDTLKLVKRAMKKFFIPSPVFYCAKMIMEKCFGVDVDELNTGEAIKKITTPMFFIHGTNNDIPVEEITELYKTKCKNHLDEIWLTEGVGHAGSYLVFPEEYIRRIVDFFKKTL